MIKRVFYFALKSSFRSEDNKCCGNAGKQFDKKAKANFKI